MFDNSKSSVSYYINEECNHEVLSKGEIIELAKRKDEGDKKAREKIIEHNKRLVIFIVKKFKNRGIEMSDLIGWGNIGLIKAVDKFDHKKGYKFSTYAKSWIESEIKFAIKTKSKNIKVSDYMSRLIYKFINFVNLYKRLNNKKPDNKTICKELDISKEKLALIINNLKDEKSIYADISKNKDDNNCLTLEEILITDRKYKLEEDIVNERLFVKLENILKRNLSDEDFYIFACREEILGHEFKTYNILAKEIGQSSENIRIRYNKISKKVRKLGEGLK